MTRSRARRSSEPERIRFTEMAGAPTPRPDDTASPSCRNAWLPLPAVVAMFGLFSIVGIVGSMVTFSRDVARSLSKAPAIDARWIDAAPGSHVRIGDTVIATVQVIAGTRAPQFGVDSFMVFVARSDSSSRVALYQRDSLVAVLRPMTQWNQPIDVELVRSSAVRRQSRVGTLRIDDLQLSIGVYRAGSQERRTSP